MRRYPEPSGPKERALADESPKKEILRFLESGFAGVPEEANKVLSYNIGIQSSHGLLTWQEQSGTLMIESGLHSVVRRLTMIDEMTKDNLRVSPDGIAGPYLMVSVTQLDAVLAVLNRHKVRYWVDADAISLDNEPAIAVINFGRSGEAVRIQAILDEAG